MQKADWLVENELGLERLAIALADVLPERALVIVHLHGDLGAGKTRFCQFFLRRAGIQGLIKSPTYTLMEVYQQSDFSSAANTVAKASRAVERKFVHFDLYRLADAEELEFLGARDVFVAPNVCLIEWPEKGDGHLPSADIHLHLAMVEGSTTKRRIRLVAQSDMAAAALTRALDVLDR